MPSTTSTPPPASIEGNENQDGDHRPRDSNGWDGKLRVERRAVITNPEALSDPEYSDEDAPPVQEIDADEGAFFLFLNEFDGQATFSTARLRGHETANVVGGSWARARADYLK